MSRLSIKKLMAAAVVTGAVGLSAAPLSASAVNGYNRNTVNTNRVNRMVTRHQARDIAQDIFPQRTIESIVRRNDDGVWEFQVRFVDGSRVDVRESNGRVTYVHSSRTVNERQARRIAEAVFPNKTVRDVVLRNNDREYRVRFNDGSRVDVRIRDGMIMNIVNNR